jgi:hypothetical protein
MCKAPIVGLTTERLPDLEQALFGVHASQKLLMISAILSFGIPK